MYHYLLAKVVNPKNFLYFLLKKFFPYFGFNKNSRTNY